MKINFKDVFLIDDDEYINFYNTDLLSDCDGIDDIYVYDNCNKALEFIDEIILTGKLPGVWFVDINMPKMNGFEFLDFAYKRLEKLNKLPKIYVLSSSNHELDKLEAEKRSFINGFLSKPLLDENIESIIAA